MVDIRVGNKFPYYSTDEKKLIEVLKKYKVDKYKYNKYEFYSLKEGVVWIIIGNIIWSLNYDLLKKIMKEFPKLIKKRK